jgi:capsular exopolysaccharide synthesis family protein
MSMKSESEIISRKDITKFIVLLFSNWYLIIAIPLLSFIVSYIYTHRIPDVYAAKCQILLKSNETYDYQQKLYSGLGFSSKYASYEETASQMRVMKSSGLINEVLDHVPLNVSYYIVGRLKITEVYKHMPFQVVLDDRSSIGSGTSFNISIIDTSAFTLSYTLEDKSYESAYKFGEIILDNGIYFKLTKSSNLNVYSITSLSKIDYMFKVFKKWSLIGKYQNAIEVENMDYTSIVEITLMDEIAGRAEEILDTLAHIYVDNTLDNKKDVNENTLGYIDKQLDEVIGIINEIEAELEDYKEQKAILNLSREEETFFSRLVEVDRNKRDYELQLKAMNELTNYLLKNDEIAKLLPPNLFVGKSDAKLAARVQKLYDLREEYSSFLTEGTTSNPKLGELEVTISRQKQDILYYMEDQRVAIIQATENLEVQIREIERKIQNIPKTQRQILNIERRLQVNEDLYSFLLSKRAETVIAKAGLIPETKIIEPAHSVGVVYPDKMRMNIMAILVGLGLVAVVILIKEMFFQKVRSLAQLQSIASIAILGSIPKQKDISRTFRILSGNEKSEITQSFRSLRTNLQYFVSDKKCQNVLVTSILPGEGKTFTSVNLASVLAIAEKKVLIIDFDLHKPRLAKALELPNDVGVSSVLIGKESIADVIQPTDIPSLSAITSGPIPPNASELIMRAEITSIFEYANQHFDYVVLDTPPISLITDGLLLMNQVDVKIFVLNSRYTTKTSIDFIESMVDKNNLDHCALVLNEEKITRMGYYDSKYGYGGYGYVGYGYGGYGYEDHTSDSNDK